MKATTTLLILTVLAHTALSLSLTEKTPETLTVCKKWITQPSSASTKTKMAFYQRHKFENTSINNTWRILRGSISMRNSLTAPSNTFWGLMRMMTESNFKSLLILLSPKRTPSTKENPAIILNKIYDIVKFNHRWYTIWWLSNLWRSCPAEVTIRLSKI